MTDREVMQQALEALIDAAVLIPFESGHLVFQGEVVHTARRFPKETEK